MNRRVFCTLFPCLGGVWSFFRDGTYDKHVKPIIENPRRLRLLRPRMPLEEIFEGVTWTKHVSLIQVRHSDISCDSQWYNRCTEAYLPKGLRFFKGQDFYGEVVLNQSGVSINANRPIWGKLLCTRTSDSIFYASDDLIQLT